MTEELVIVILIAVVSWFSGLAFGAAKWWHEHFPPDDWFDTDPTDPIEVETLEWEKAK